MTMKKQTPADCYEHILAYGIFMGQSLIYIQGQQALAAAQGAPHTALYKGADGMWHTALWVQSTAQRVAQILGRIDVRRQFIEAQRLRRCPGCAACNVLVNDQLRPRCDGHGVLPC